MKKFVVVWLLIAGLFAIVPAQSGRKIEPTATPSPVIEQTEEKTYSESVPVKQRRTTIQPKLEAPKTVQPQTQASTVKTDGEAVEDEGGEVKVETNLITIPVSVFDRNGLYIPNLAQENFKIFEDGVEQEIAYFAASEKPFSVIIVLDTSLSSSYKIEEIQDAAIAFVNQLKPQDSVMIVEFAQYVNVLCELTTDRQKIFKGIRKADIDPGTSLYDAVNGTLVKRLGKIQGRKAIILFTDGVDTTSDDATYEGTVKLAEETDATIFPIYYNTFLDNRRLSEAGIISDRGTTRAEYALGKKYIEDLAEVTGGRVFAAEAGGSGLKRTFESIAEELRRQYSIGYYPQEVGESGQRKQIRVRVNRPNLVVRARDSYIVGAVATPATITPVKTQ